MDISRLIRNKFNQNRTSENWHKYETLRNKCANILRKTKKITLLKLI